MSPAAALLLALASQVTDPVSGRALESLRPGERLERPLTGDDRLTYAAVVPDGHLLPVVVRQHGVDVTVTVTGPDGARRAVDAAAGLTWGDEPVSLGPRGGTYRVEVAQAIEPLAVSGRVTIAVGEPRPVTAEERARLDAERELADAVAAAARADSADALTGAVARLEAVSAAWDRLGERSWAALAGLLAAERQLGLSPPGALQAAQQALASFRDLGRRGEEAWSLLVVSQALFNRGAPKDALAPGLEAVALFRGLGDLEAEAIALDELGGTYLELGETRESERVRERALELGRSIGSRRREAAALANLGATYWFAGEIDKAYDLFLLSGKALREQGNRLGEAATLHNQAFCDLFMGQPARAEAPMREALPLCRAAANRPCEAYVLQGLGMVLDAGGRSDEALKLYDEALEIRRELHDREGQAWSLVTAALTRHRRGEGRQAAELAHRALELYREIGGGWKLALLLDLMGEIASAAGDRETALARHREALELRQATRDRHGEAVSWLRLARLDRAAGLLIEARGKIETALGLLEEVRGRVQSPERRTAFMVGTTLWLSLRDAYQDYVDVLTRLHRSDPGAGFDVRAFEASERARARVLVELLSQAGGRHPGVEPSEVERLRRIEDRLSFKLDQQVRELSAGAAPERRRALAAEVEAATRELDEARAELRAGRPRDADLIQPPPLSLRELQAEGLDDDTVLVEYTLGAERSHAFVVTATSLASFELPGRTRLEAAALRAHTAVSMRPGAGEAGGADLAEAGDLLLRPVAASLRKKRLLIVADGALHYLPFAALPDPDRPSQPLVARLEVVHLPSAATLLTLRRERGARRPASRGVAVLADPVFEAGDPRLGRARPPSSGTSRDRALARAVESVEFSGAIPRLPFTRREARAILAAAAGSASSSSSSRAALDFEASRVTLADPELGQYRVLHLATHGFLNASRPELSGILLSLFDAAGRPQPGFLSAADAFGLRLGADLVVLSACRTALGKEVSGEGIVGLTRGFLHAGAGRVMASLWKVDDAATAALMARFYRALLGPKAASPAAALREAQLELRGRPRFRHPYYWAAFQLQGEWR